MQAGRVDVGFLGAAQIDRYANLNTTVVGDYTVPKVRLPGAGGAAEIAASCRRVIIVIRHSPRTFVDRLDFITSVGYGRGPGSRRRLGLRGAGPSEVITDLGLLHPDPETAELTLTHMHPGVTVDQVRAAIGWDLVVAPDLRTTAAPSEDELGVLRALEKTKEIQP